MTNHFSDLIARSLEVNALLYIVVVTANYWLDWRKFMDMTTEEEVPYRQDSPQ